MNIYNINDEIDDSKKKLAENDDEFRVTGLKQGVKNPNRVNVFINDEYSFSLDISQVVDYKLKIGDIVTAEKLAELKNASEFGKLYQRTLEWVLVRPRSIKETKDYLYRKLTKTSSEEISRLRDEIIERLVSKGYLDDDEFAQYYVENRFVKKGISRERLKMELMRKGVLSEIIEKVLDSRNDEEEIKKIIAKKRDKYDDDKLISYLVRQGFSYQLARSLVLETD